MNIKKWIYTSGPRIGKFTSQAKSIMPKIKTLLPNPLAKERNKWRKKLNKI